MSLSSGPRPSWMYIVGRGLLRPALRLRYRPRISGLQHVPTAGPVLLVSNHLSGLDTILIPCFAPRQVRFLAKASLFKTPFRRWIMEGIGAVAVYREAGSEAQAALDTGKQILESGSVFAVFPEGSRSTTGLLNRGRSGAAWLALETGATLVPVGLRGTAKKQRALGSKQRVEMRVGAPIDISDLAGVPQGRARREATERIMNAIQALSGQERSQEFAEGGRGA